MIELSKRRVNARERGNPFALDRRSGHSTSFTDG